MVKWKTGLTAVLRKQVNFGLEISMKDTKFVQGVEARSKTNLLGKCNVRPSLKAVF